MYIRVQLLTSHDLSRNIHVRLYFWSYGISNLIAKEFYTTFKVVGKITLGRFFVPRIRFFKKFLIKNFLGISTLFSLSSRNSSLNMEGQH